MSLFLINHDLRPEQFNFLKLLMVSNEARLRRSAGSAAIHLAADPASRRNLALFDSMEHFVHEMLYALRTA